MLVLVGPEKAQIVVGPDVVGIFVQDLLQPLFGLVQPALDHAEGRHREPGLAEDRQGFDRVFLAAEPREELLVGLPGLVVTLGAKEDPGQAAGKAGRVALLFLGHAGGGQGRLDRSQAARAPAR